MYIFTSDYIQYIHVKRGTPRVLHVLHEISILIVIADPGIFIRIIQSYLCTINSIAGIAT